MARFRQQPRREPSLGRRPWSCLLVQERSRLWIPTAVEAILLLPPLWCHRGLGTRLLPPPVGRKRHPGRAPQGILLALFVSPLRPLADRQGLEAVVGLALVPHRQERARVEALGQQHAGA